MAAPDAHSGAARARPSPDLSTRVLEAGPDAHDELVATLRALDDRERRKVLGAVLAGPARVSAAAAQVVVDAVGEAMAVPPDLGEHICPVAVDIFATSSHPGLRFEVCALLARDPSRARQMSPGAWEAIVNGALYADDDRLSHEGLSIVLDAVPLGRPLLERVARHLHTLTVRPHASALTTQFGTTDPEQLDELGIAIARGIGPVIVAWEWIRERFRRGVDDDRLRAGLARLGMTPRELALASTSVWGRDLWAGPVMRELVQLAPVEAVRTTRIGYQYGLEVLQDLLADDPRVAEIASEMYRTWTGTMTDLIPAARDLAR